MSAVPAQVRCRRVRVVTSGLLAVSDAADQSDPVVRRPRSRLVIVGHNDTPRLADASEADEVARLLHDFNTEFETPSPGADVLSERLAVLLAGESMFAILAG